MIPERNEIFSQLSRLKARNETLSHKTDNLPEDAFRVLDVTMVDMVSPSDQGVCQKRLYITPATIKPSFSFSICFIYI